MVQTNLVLAIASDEDNPITAAISTAIDNLTNPSPAATSTPAPSASPAPSSNPISAPIVNPSPAPTSIPVSAPISIPVTQPTPVPSSNPLTSPVTSPVINPSASPTPSPSLTPAPKPAPTLNAVFPNPATWGTVVVLTGSNLTNSTQIYINNSLVPSNFYKPASDNGNSISFTLPVFADYQATHSYKLYVKEGNLKSNELTLAIAPSVVDQHPPLTASQVLIEPIVSLDANHPELVVDYSNFNTNVFIPKSVVRPTVNLSSTLSTWGGTAYVVFNNILNLNAETTFGTIKVEIPAAIVITGPLNWNGVMNAPQISSITGTTPVADTGKIATPQVAVEVGLGDTPLTLNKAVRIVIPGQAGKLAGFQRGPTFTKIVRNCTADTQDAGNNLPVGGDCYISAGSDLVIWTKHFTKFVTYTETPVVSGSNSNSQSSGNNSQPQAPICGDSKPVSSPKLVYAKATGRNEVTLVWTKAADPVSFYLVAYGTKPGQPEYGNPNIGGKDTQSYVVKGLDTGQTYYFKVRAGNGCMPGEFSNELSVPVLGDKLSGPAKGFKSGVLSSTKAELKFKPITEAKPDRLVKTGSPNFLTKVFNFLLRFFQG